MILSETNDIAQVNIQTHRERLEQLDRLKYLVSSITRDGSVRST